MSDWAAANLSPTTHCRSSHETFASEGKKRSTETVEAALARLTASYIAAMSAVGALHKASTAIAKVSKTASTASTTSENDGTAKLDIEEVSNNHLVATQLESSAVLPLNQQETSNKSESAINTEDTATEEDRVDSLRRVARAARRALEMAVLSDPLIAPLATTLHQALYQTTGCKISMTSAVHQSALRKLTYLSLLNYADLLTCSCSCSLHRTETNYQACDEFQNSRPDDFDYGILDRGAVSLLDALQGPQNSVNNHDTSTTCLWNGETEEETKRLALIAYCDAADLDGSDPTIWYKLACAARTLGRVVHMRKDQERRKKFEDSKLAKKVCEVVDRGGDECQNEVGASDVSFDLEENTRSPKNSGFSNVKVPREKIESTEATEVSTRLSKTFYLANAEESEKQADGDMHVSLVPQMSHRRLERYALEQGSRVLSQRVPPNRAIARALRELNEREEQLTVDMNEQGSLEPQRVNIVIDLTRYSWSALGRMLMRACRDGGEYNNYSNWLAPKSPRHHHKSLRGIPFGSPIVLLRVSPMLTLPSTALGTVCEFLGSEMPELTQDVKRFEATCRALSVEIMSARASMERERNLRMRQMEHELTQKVLEDEDMKKASIALLIEHDRTGVDGADHKDYEGIDEQKEASRERPAVLPSYRSSKRVRSQLITSGKQAERSSKRLSVEYCLVSVILFCTTDHPMYISLLRKPVEWENLPSLKGSAKFIQSIFLSSPNPVVQSAASCGNLMISTAKERILTRILEATARAGTSSLNSFIQRWNNNSGPLNVLYRFLSHISCHVQDVFSSEASGMMVLSTCVVECFDVLTSRSGYREGMCPYWYGDEACVALTTKSIEVFAMNLLNAEMRLRRSERQNTTISDYDDDVNTLKSMIPLLIHYCDSFGQTVAPTLDGKIVASLRTRSHWLAANFYLWWSRMSRKLTDVRDAERAAVKHIDQAIELLKTPASDPVLVVLTPQLVSPGRSGHHWKKLSDQSLKTFRDDLEASAVVSRARQEFRDLQIQILNVKQRIGDLSQDEKAKLGNIGESLLRRFNVEYEGRGGKHEELIDDFLASCGNVLLPENGFEINEDILGAVSGNVCDSPCIKWSSIWEFIPSTSTLLPSLCVSATHPLLSILSICLQAKNDTEVPLLLLLARFTLAAFDQHSQVLVQNAEAKNIFNRNNQSDIDSSDDDDEVANEAGVTSDAAKAKLLLSCGMFFIDKLTDVLSKCDRSKAVVAILSGSDILAVGHVAMYISSGIRDNQSFSAKEGLFKIPPPDLKVLSSSLSLVSAILNIASGNDNEVVRDKILSSTFTVLVKLLVQQRYVLPAILRSKGDNRLGRSARQKSCVVRSAYTAAIATELATMLSFDLSTRLTDGMLGDSFLLKSIIDQEVGEEVPSSSLLYNLAPLAQLTDSVIWFWKYVMSSEIIDAPSLCGSSRAGVSPSNSIDRNVAKRLVIPVAAVIIALCGCSGNGPSCHVTKEILIKKADFVATGSCTLSDFFSSDDSAKTGYDSDDAVDGNTAGVRARRDLLRLLCRSVQCIGLLFSGIDDKLASARSCSILFPKDHGPLLPLVVARTLTHICDIFLSHFNDEDQSGGEGVWSEEYPFGARTAGVQLDALLCKAYKCLHGFNLVGHTHQGTMNKDFVCPASSASSSPFDPLKYRHYPPESTKAAASLYRCICRVYSKGRRTPPKASLECVASALPPEDETENRKSIQNFIFASKDDTSQDRLETAESVLVDHALLEIIPSDFPLWLFDKGGDQIYSFCHSGHLDGHKSPSNETHDTSDMEICLVRKGICQRLAEGPLPRVGSKSHEATEASTAKMNEPNASTNMAEERETTARTENALHKKLLSVIDYLCYEPANCEGWFRAGLCLSIKADIINNRIASPIHSYNPDFFFVPPTASRHRRQQFDTSLLPLNELLKSQSQDHYARTKNWRPFIGKDLSLYSSYSWANFAQLKGFASVVRQKICNNNLAFSNTGGDSLEQKVQQEDSSGMNSTSELAIWSSVQSMLDTGEYFKWQQTWGSMFVAALQHMAKRCLSVALYLSRQLRGKESGEDSILPEIAENLGTANYAELMGSMTLEYPLQVTTLFQKRGKAKLALAFFQEAIDFSSAIDKKTSDVLNVALWDLFFMIGKCKEKIAKTVADEEYSLPIKGGETHSSSECTAHRAYESLMTDALNSYAKAIFEAKIQEKEGGLPDVQVGGSSHGITEFVYRLHASRLKILLRAVKQPQGIREHAEQEALRLTEAHWFEEPDDDEMSLKALKSTRERVWTVLADVIAGLAHCRRESSFFHRSVYRHAQALLWAPVFHDPEAGYEEGSLGTVPASKSFRFRGLNSGSCANSAEVIMAVLFEKKRLQLCAVWVTTPASPSPFEVLNDSVRKYDCLRRKYIGAFLDCMKLCKRKQTIMTFLTWAQTCKRDLTSFYQASASQQGEAPKQVHTRDNLLLGVGLLCAVKRQANEALSELVLLEIDELKSQEAEGSIGEESVKAVLRDAFECFLRLNCATSDPTWAMYDVEHGTILEVEAMCDAFKLLHEIAPKPSSEISLWERKMLLLNCAVKRCEFYFPLIANSYVHNKKKKRKAPLIHEGVVEVEKKLGKVESASDEHGRGDDTSRRKEDVLKTDDVTSKPRKKGNESKHKLRKRSIVIMVPQGLKEGELFEVKVILGSFCKNARLAVPKGSPSKLRFSLKLPDSKCSVLKVQKRRIENSENPKETGGKEPCSQKSLN